MSSARKRGPISALRPPPSPPGFAENLQTTASCQRIVIHGREAVLDEVMVANGSPMPRRTTEGAVVDVGALILTSSDLRKGVDLSSCRPVVVVVVVLRQRA